MPDLPAHAGTVFFGLALLAFLGVAAWESRQPLFPSTPRLAARWAGNFGLFVAGHLGSYLLVPVLTVMAAWHQGRMGGSGLDAAGVALGWQVLAAFLVLDALRWALHATLHHVPMLWRLHQVHHCDTEFDCTVGVRFHPLEVLLTALLSSAAMLLLGASPLAVVLAEAVFILHNFFCHANAALPPRVEGLLARWVVTPDLHRVHHAAQPALANRNFGTVLTLWDRLAGTLMALPRDSQPALRFGVAGVDGPWAVSVWRLLVLPWRSPRAP